MKFKKTIRDIDLQGKILLLRVDYNVPFDSSTGKISDDSRIQATLPTIKYLLDRNAKLSLYLIVVDQEDMIRLYH